MLKLKDPELHSLIQEEYERQCLDLELIASENYASKAVLECLGSVMTNKYSEGRPGKRYYGGNQVIDKVERLCEKRCLAAFGLDPKEWDVDVQPYSGSVANFAVYTGLLSPGDRIVSLDLPSGGHLSHGYQRGDTKVTATSIYFNVKPYHVKEDGYIDYEELEMLVSEFQPKLVICGASAYPRDYDYSRFRNACDQVGAYFMCDVAHTAGLIATGVLSSPFEYADIVTTTTHKTLKGPRAAVIFINKRTVNPKMIHDAVFPKLQGGPHENQIAAIAAQMLEVTTPEFKTYSEQVVKNCQALGDYLRAKGFQLMTDGTDNHLLLVSLRNFGITGSKMEKLCERVHISLNKNTIYGDKNPLSPTGIRIGTPCITSRGMKEDQMESVAEWLLRAAQLCVKIQEVYGKKVKDFVKGLEPDSQFYPEIRALEEDVVSTTSGLPFY